MSDEYFQKWLNERFEHLDQRMDAILEQTTKTNGRVNDLEDDVKILNHHKSKDEGTWKAYGRLATIGGGLVGGIIAWIANKIL